MSKLKREYDGPSIDATEQYISERNGKGETIGGTTEDDLFDQNTDWLPNGMDESDFTNKQKRALRAYISHSDRESITPPKLAEGHDFGKDTAVRAIHKAFPDSRELEDLSDSRQLAIKIIAFEGEGKTQTELADDYPAPSRSIGEAQRIYTDLVEEVKPITERELQAAVDEYEQTHKTDQTKPKSKDPIRVQKTQDEKEYPADFSDTYQWFIETIAQHPDKSAGEIGELMPDDADFSKQNYYNVIKDYGDIVRDRIGEMGTATSEDDVSDYLMDHIDGFDFETADDESDSSQPSETANDSLERRVRAVESKTELLRQEVNAIETPQTSTEKDLATALVDSLSDKRLGELVREEVLNE